VASRKVSPTVSQVKVGSCISNEPSDVLLPPLSLIVRNALSSVSSFGVSLRFDKNALSDAYE